MILIRPEDIWPVDGEYADYYAKGVEGGRQVAKQVDANIVAICRNAEPFLVNTLYLCREVADGFKSCRMFVYENDSSDNTAGVLDTFATMWPSLTVKHETLGTVDIRNAFQGERTERLAYCRNQCLEWVRKEASAAPYTIVLDMDPHGGFSVDGVFNSIHRLGEKMFAGYSAGGMASYSLYRDSTGFAHYDAFAARPVCWERDRRNEIGFTWFSTFLPPVGSPPVEMNSAFGGLAVYYTAAYLDGGYSGEDCEHVTHHRRMRQAGHKLWLNPGCRYHAFDGQ